MALRATLRQSLGLFAAAALALAGSLLTPASSSAQELRGSQPAGFPVATDSRLAGDERQTRFVMDLSRRIELRAFTLADPYRVVIDLPQTNFNLPPRIGETGRGLVKAYRFGLVMQGGSRIVLDVGKPVRIDRAFVLEAAAGQPARLVLDMTAVDRDTFMRTLALESKPVPPALPPRERETASRSDPRPVVVLDPGHGGIDNGTLSGGSGVAEKQIVLEFAMLLRDQLEKTGRYRVVMTRTDDTFVSLSDRVQMARTRQAALFVSIHADALRKGEGDAQGATVYTLSDTASDAEAARLADTENRADVISGIDLSHESNDVADILIDLAQRETKAFSTLFAKTLVNELKNVARLHKNPMKSAGFKVLKSPDVPSVLLELGYVSSKEDLKQLLSATWRQKTARSVVQAIDGFFSTRIPGATASAVR